VTDFDRSMKFVASWEGGFVDHPSDPGGRTNMGVTQKTYDAWREQHDQKPEDVKLLTRYEANAIYKDQYWDAAGCDVLRWPLCLVQFDTAVNLGVGRAQRMLKEAKSDTSMYLHLRRNYYTALANQKPKLKVFLNGWLNRVRALGKTCDAT
jgi:lysozyme family protein